MTKVMINIDDISGIFFDCQMHSGDHDACTIISTLCNVLVEECFRQDREPTIYNPGHVRIDMPYSDAAYEVFAAVEEVMQQAARQHPEHIKIY